MSVLRPRSRLVYFRVSEDEFRQLNEMCVSMGARSISDLARQSIQRTLDGQGKTEAGDGLAERIERLTSLLEGLEARFEKRMAAGADGKV